MKDWLDKWVGNTRNRRNARLAAEKAAVLEQVALPEQAANPIEAQRAGAPMVYGDGLSVLTPIEGAARAGYMDAVHQAPFSAEWEISAPQWQRNYEAGRLWVVGIRSAGLTCPEWPEGERVPQSVFAALAQVRLKTGSGTRPEDYRPEERPAEDAGPMHITVPVVRRGRVVGERIV